MEWRQGAIHTGNLRTAYNISVKEIEELYHPQGLDTNSDSPRAGWSWERIPVEKKFSAPVQKALRPNQPSIQWESVLFPWGKAAGAWCWTPTPHLAPRLKKEQSCTSTSLWVFVACSGGELYLYLYLYLSLKEWRVNVRIGFITLRLGPQADFRCEHFNFSECLGSAKCDIYWY